MLIHLLIVTYILQHSHTLHSILYYFVLLPAVHIELYCLYNPQQTNKLLALLYEQNQRGEAEAALLEGQEQLNVLKRQAVLGNLYPSAKSVMEMA